MNSYPPLEPEQAWLLLWEKLTQCADELWQAYPNVFADRCLEKSRLLSLTEDQESWEDDFLF